MKTFLAVCCTAVILVGACWFSLTQMEAKARRDALAASPYPLRAHINRNHYETHFFSKPEGTGSGVVTTPEGDSRPVAFTYNCRFSVSSGTYKARPTSDGIVVLADLEDGTRKECHLHF